MTKQQTGAEARTWRDIEAAWVRLHNAAPELLAALREGADELEAWINAAAAQHDIQKRDEQKQRAVVARMRAAISAACSANTEHNS